MGGGGEGLEEEEEEATLPLREAAGAAAALVLAALVGLSGAAAAWGLAASRPAGRVVVDRGGCGRRCWSGSIPRAEMSARSLVYLQG